MRRYVTEKYLWQKVLAILYIVIIAFLISPAQASGDEKSVIEARISESASLSDLLTYAYNYSPVVKAAKASWKGAIEKYRVETGYPDPQLIATYWPYDPVRNWSNKKFGAMLTQTIPYPGKLAAAGRVAENESHIARLELDRAIRDVAVTVRESYHELQYIRDAVRIAGLNRQALENLRKIGEAAYPANRATLFDVLKAQSQSGQVHYDILLLQELEKTEITRLNAILNRPVDAKIGHLAYEPMTNIVYDLDDIYRFSELNREEIREAAAAAGKSVAEADVARYQNRPEFMLGLQYEYTVPDMPDGPASNMFGIQFGMTLPIWWNKNSGRREAARAGTEKTSALVTSQINQTRSIVRETFFRLKNAERLVTLYRDQLLPQAVKSVETAEIWNRDGQGSFSDFVETQAVLYNFQLALARARADFGKYLARLEAIAGVSLTLKTEVIEKALLHNISRGDADFTVQKKLIEKMAHQWEDSLKPLGGNGVRFFLPSPDKFSALKQASDDSAFAVKSISGEFSLETLEVIAFLRNLGIASAEKLFKGKLQGYTQVSNTDDILRQYSAFTQAVMTGVGSMEERESPAMKFPFPGVMALKGQIVSQELKIASEELETARKSAVTASRRVYWNLGYNYRAIEITGSMLEFFDQLEISALKRYEVGKAGLQDVIRVQILKAKMQEELITLKEERKNLKTKILNILDLPYGSNIGFPEIREPRREIPEIEKITALAFERSQDLRKMKAMIGRMERMIEMAETEIYPGFTQNLSLFENKAVNQVGSIRTDEPFSVVSKSYTGEGLPKNPWFGLGDAYLLETRERLKALQNDLKNAENETNTNVREAWFRLHLAIREEKLFSKKIKELSRLSAEITGMRYEAGVAEMKDVIEFYMSLLEVRLTSERKKIQIETARADLEEIVGTSF